MSEQKHPVRPVRLVKDHGTRADSHFPGTPENYLELLGIESVEQSRFHHFVHAGTRFLLPLNLRFRKELDDCCMSCFFVGLRPSKHFLKENSSLEKQGFRALVVDDFPPMRNLICGELKHIPEIHMVAEASNGTEAVEKARELQPDLILIDMELPQLSGIKAVRQILSFIPDSRILFLSQDSSPEFVQEAHAVGAKGFLAKMHLGRLLHTAVKAVLRGETAFMGLALVFSGTFAI